MTSLRMNDMPAPEEFVEAHWDEIVDDIAMLVAIPSVSEPERASEGAPFGPEVRRALDAAVAIAQRRGLPARADEGYAGICDVPGASDTTLGVIGHVDVVPAGPGWHFDPFRLEERDGYLIGRGTTDDKGPVVLALWALKYWADAYDVQNGGKLPHPVRFIFGTSEENGMLDIPYLRAHYDAPAFLFTPDASFPVCNGEKGMYGVLAKSAFLPAESRKIRELHAGTVPNAVAGTAYAIVSGPDGPMRVETTGSSAHASTPQEGECALKKLLAELLAMHGYTDEERSFLEFAALLAHDFYGESLGIAASDDFFGPLTSVAGTMHLEGERLCLTYDVRYPTTTDGNAITEALERGVRSKAPQSELSVTSDKAPFLVDADAQPVRALLGAFEAVTGRDAKPFTMGGGTYAREFPCACSFGAEMPWLETPSWVGGMHGPDEGISIEQAKQTLLIYIEAFRRLFACDLDSHGNGCDER